MLDRALTILIADDSNSDRLLLDAIIKKQGHRTLLAEDGRVAIDLFKRHSPDIILLDALMPNLDGFETAKFIKSQSQDHFVPIIFLTSLNETQSLAACLDAGGDDFLTKPYNSVILKAKINAFTRMLKMHVTLQAQRDQIAENNNRLIREQEVAKLTFDKIAHEGCLQADNIQYILSPLAIFNGDVLLAARRPNGNLCVILGDFTGHGLSAAVGAIPFSQAFYSMVAKGFSIKDIATELNAKLKEILPLGIFCCACIVDVNFGKQSVEFWVGGLPDIFIYKAKTKDVLRVKSKHLPMGILETHQFKTSTEAMTLDLDDRLFIWSDGVVEAENKQKEQFGEGRLEQVFTDCVEPSLLFSNITQAISQFVGAQSLSDDLSIVEIKMISKADFDAYDTKSPENTVCPPIDWSFSLVLDHDSLKDADPLPLMQQLLLNAPGVRSFSADVFLIISELFNNALDHGLLKLDSGIKSSPNGFSIYYSEREERLKTLCKGEITITVHYSGSGLSGRLSVTVEDSGEGFDYEKINTLQFNETLYSGRGIKLARTLAADLRYYGSGNKAKATFDW